MRVETVGTNSIYALKVWSKIVLSLLAGTSVDRDRQEAKWPVMLVSRTDADFGNALLLRARLTAILHLLLSVTFRLHCDSATII
jgi:hypothetical protein